MFNADWYSKYFNLKYFILLRLGEKGQIKQFFKVMFDSC